MSHIKVVILIDTESQMGRDLLDMLGTHGVARVALEHTRQAITDGTTASGGSLADGSGVYGRWDWSQVIDR